MRTVRWTANTHCDFKRVFPSACTAGANKVATLREENKTQLQEMTVHLAIKEIEINELKTELYSTRKDVPEGKRITPSLDKVKHYNHKADKALCLASEEGDLEGVRALIENGPHPDCRMTIVCVQRYGQPLRNIYTQDDVMNESNNFIPIAFCVLIIMRMVEWIDSTKPHYINHYKKFHRNQLTRQAKNDAIQAISFLAIW